MSAVSYAQDANNKWALSFGVNAIDFRTSAGGGKNWLDNHFSQLFMIKKNWNTLPSITLGASKYIGYNVSANFGLSINKIDKYEYNANQNEFYNSKSVSYYDFSLRASYSFMKLIHSKKIEPTYNLGMGYTVLGKNNFQTVDMGLGLKYWKYKNIGISATGIYKWAAFSNTNVNYTNHRSHIQWLLTVNYKFGAKDTDKDGIYDKQDACPQTAGLLKYQSCPDSDGDTIIDKNDECPEIAGLVAFNGCPDTDGDGIPDKDDKCPELPGLLTFKGCQDTDEDGIVDQEDECCLIIGPKENKGCPWPDSDADGVADKDDKCPQEIGTIANNGCPEVPEEVIMKLNEYAKTIFFKPGKSTFKAETLLVLQSIVEILEQYPRDNFSIEGHSDSKGDPEKNLRLSKNRAAAVRKYFIYNGIAPERLTSEGYGDTQPIDTNESKSGRVNNRRVDVKLVK